MQLLTEVPDLQRECLRGLGFGDPVVTEWCMVLAPYAKHRRMH